MDRVRLVYLAAGNSRRFGSNKLLHEINGVPMYAYGLDVLEQVLQRYKNSELYVVTRFDSILDTIQTVHPIQKTPLSSDVKSRIHVVNEPNCTLGISYSIRAGLKQMVDTEEPKYYLFMVADQPHISVETVIALMDGTLQKKAVGGCVTWDGVLGNPVMFSSALKKELFQLRGDTGGKKVLLRYENEIYKVSAKNSVELIDHDTPNA